MTQVAAEDFAVLNAEPAKEQIATADAEQLKAYLAAEKGNKNRATVIDAIKERATQLKAEADEKEKATTESLKEATDPSKDLPPEPVKTKVPPAPDANVLRPEVMHAEHTAPVEGIREHLEARRADAEEAKKAKKEPDESIDVPVPRLRDFLTPSEVVSLRSTIEHEALETEIEEKGLAEAKKIKPSTLREAAELHSNYKDLHVDPVKPAPVESSAVDSHSQHFDRAIDAAEALRLEVLDEQAGYPETGSQHQAASEAADRGEAWTSDTFTHPNDPEYLAARDEETATEDERLRRWAKGLLPKLKKAGAHVAPRFRTEGVPNTARQFDSYEDIDELDPGANALRPLSAVYTGGIGIGSAVSRLDDSHGEVGIVIGFDRSSVSYPLAEVIWPTEGTTWLPIINLANEGRAEDLIQS